MPQDSLIPQPFGPLQGVRILSTGSLIAQPYGAALAAEMGAEVIQFSGRELFLKLAATADIWMESSKPGSYNRWGLDDEALWKVNPKLVITHISGYGQHGDPDYIKRASYDIVGQAFSGMMYQTGYPDNPPTRAAPWTGDYITALHGLWSTLAALTYARAHGKGQSIDVAQFETIHRTTGGTMVEYFQQGVVRERSGNRALGFQPLDSFATSDGWIVMGALTEVYNRLVTAIGLDPQDPKWQSARTNLESIEGIEFDAILRGWVAERTTAEVVRTLNEAQVPCAPIMTSAAIAEDPHYAARGMHLEWEDGQVGPVKGSGIAPKFSLTPGQVWRGSVRVGYDNQRIYGDVLGLSAAELADLRSSRII